ncbi:MAG: hypothetical protein K0S74_1756 [Chlamydiales bacterium]|jgi:ribosomal protein S18 acetylase RimI-like enzyme|nr:hypothetical protein [Chlamydiales bacterium]
MLSLLLDTTISRSDQPSVTQIWCEDSSAGIPTKSKWRRSAKSTEKIKNLIISTFEKVYEPFTEKDLNISDKRKFLEELAEEDIRKNAQAPSSMPWLIAKQDEKVIGYSSFDLSQSPDEIYIRLLCVSPESQGQKLGEKLIFPIVDLYPNKKYLTLTTRKLNERALGFYKKLGFETTDKVYEGVDPNLYYSLRLELIT